MWTQLGAEAGALTKHVKNHTKDSCRADKVTGAIRRKAKSRQVIRGEALIQGSGGLKDEGQGKVFPQREQCLQRPCEGGSK